jgi:predicted TPR repeat methyltransferase
MRSDTQTDRQAYFDSLYDGNADPWRYDDCDYEIAKRRDTLSFLRDHYETACEIGCSNGVLTRELAPRCTSILGIDIAQAAAQMARERLADLPQAQIRVMHLPHDDLPGRFDLLVLSEVLYFLSPAELSAMADLAARKVMPGGDLIIVSYDGETRTDLTGRQATDAFLSHAQSAFDLLRAGQREQYHVRLLRRRDA